MSKKNNSLIAKEQSVCNLTVVERDQFKQQSEHSWLKVVCPVTEVV